MKLLKQPLWQTVIVLAVAYILIRFGIAYIPPLLGARSAPVPASVVLQYMATILVAVLLYMSADEERWRQFRQPLHELLVKPDRRNARVILLILVPLLVGWMTYDRVRPRVSAPPALRSIHPAPPNTITFRGETLDLGTIVNPLRSSGDFATHYEEGKRVYYQNCLPCHGDHLGGRGQWADAFSPVPANFQNQGTIAQLSESFVFWRIAKGGPGLPSEGTPWNSAMPAWEDMLTAEEIWAVILFLYEQTGWQPRVMEAH